ncbi:MAG TPA: single-stranded DNA-binding protein [Verrucomicrobiae bacterium]|jgi:single-strand DNA-binding protein|nr:single-stranded DNA-binding protein [Verrucomicrobiae bacterium]
MAASFNKVLLMGNLTRDPELRYVPSGQPVTTFTVACNRTYVSQSGEKKEEVSFIRCVVWGKTAENCNEYLKKGSPVFVEGRLQSRSWEAQDGTKKSTIEVQAQSVQFLSRGGKSQDGAPDADVGDFEGASAPKSKGSKGSVSVSDSELQPDEEIPF